MAGKDERRTRIIESAIGLARGRGFEKVGLREVADEAGVALGTLYKFFDSKEAIISAAVEHQAQAFGERMEKEPATGDTAVLRLESVFAQLTEMLCAQPAFTRGLIQSLTARDPEMSAGVVAHEEEANRLIVAALRGVLPRGIDAADYTDGEKRITFILRQVWFAGLFGWTGGLFDEAEIVSQVVNAAELVLAGAEAKGLL